MNAKNLKIRFCSLGHVIATEQSGSIHGLTRVGVVRSFNKHYIYYNLVASNGAHSRAVGHITSRNDQDNTDFIASVCDCIARTFGSKAYKKRMKALKELKAKNQSLKHALDKTKKELADNGLTDESKKSHHMPF